MKRFISLLLCVVMCMSVFTATAGQVLAAGNASNIFAVTNTEFANNEITYTVKVAANQTKIAGAVINVCFDSNILEVVKGGAAGSYNADGDFVPTVSGMYEAGLKHNDKGVYAIAFMNLNGVNVGSTAKNMFTVTFRGKSDNRPFVNVDFKCVEYVTDDGNTDNDILKTDGEQTFASHSFHTLAMPKVTEVNSYGDGLRVVWNASEGAESYKLYRKVAGASGWTLVNDSITTNEYVDNSISKGTEYYYTVSASNSFGDTQYDNTGLSGMNFGSIDSISAVLNGTSAVVSWSTLAGAEKYEVYRKTSASSEWQKIATVTSAAYTDNSLSSGVTYSYKVRAIKGSYTADISCAPATVKYLAAPVATASNVNDGIEISFPAVGGAEKYIIERKTANGEFSVIAEIDGEEESYIDENVVAGTQYTYRLQSVASDMTSSKSVTASVTRLGTPVLKAIANKANGLEISWNAVSGATSYVVYRKVVGESVMTVCARVSSTTYLDTNVVSGEGYVYIVSAVNASGEGAYDSNGISGVYLATPSLKQVASQGENIVFTWNAVLGAESYNVYRVEAGKTNWTKVANVTELSYTDVKPTKGVVYKYTVSAVKGAYESLYNTTGLDGMNFGSVDSISAVAVENGAKITWSAVSGATTYEVYRKLASSSEWSSQPIAKVSTTEYTDTSIISGVTYDYKVKAINGKYEAEMSCDAATVKFLSMPVIGSVVITNGAVKLEWNAIQGADSYNIYRVEAGKTNWVKIGNTTTRNFSDTTAALNVNYKYTISAVSGDVESKYGINCKDAVNFGTITTITATPVSGGAKISWNALSKATKYELYRKAGSGAWTLLTTVTTTTYTDTTLQSGVLYQYMVKAYCGTLLSEMTAAPAQAKILATPTAVAKNVAEGIQITITPVNGAEGYIIEKEVNGAYVVIKNLGANETVFVDTEVQAEKTYKYKVYATSSVTTSFACDVPAILRLSNPKISSASNLVPGITMTWTTIEGAVSYTVLRKAPGETEWKTIKTGLTTNTFTDGNVENGLVYTYTIKAVMADGSETGYDPVGRSVTFVETPDLIKVSNTVGGVNVTWTAIEGATSYRVYRRGAGATYWYYLGDVTGTSFIDKETGTSTSIKSANYYRYTVRAVNNYYSGFDTNGLYLKYVGSPKLTGISNSTNGIYIKWNAVAGVTNGYRVYRRGAGATYWYYLGTVKTTYYTDTAIKNASGNYYRYTVIADSGTYSAFDTTGLFIRRLTDPVLVSAKSYSAGITVTWRAVTGANAYNVYRKTGSSGWTYIGKSTKTSYVDKTARKGTTYTYTVRACSGATLSSYNTKGISCKDLY